MYRLPDIELESLFVFPYCRNHFHVDTSGQIAYMYVFSLDGKLNLDIATPESAVCRDAVVCQEKSRDGRFHRNLGTWASRKYFMEGRNPQMTVGCMYYSNLHGIGVYVRVITYLFKVI